MSMSIDDLKLPDVPRELAGRVPEGAVSIETTGGKWVLRASRSLQKRFNSLMERRKDGHLSADEESEYAAICELDDLLSGFNRVLRRLQQD